MKAILVIVLLITHAIAAAADVPRRSPHDKRVRYVTYKSDDVVVINVRRGVVTRLVLDRGEQITASGTGFAAHCDKADLEWCIRADRGTNQVWIKPRSRATHNNLELATNKRDYSIRFEVLPNARRPNSRGDDMYRVIFQYPVRSVPLPPALYADPSRQGASPSIRVGGQPGYRARGAAEGSVDQKLNAPPEPRNTQYTMETLGGGARIAPKVVFDDGRFTYFYFPNNRDIPAPFTIGADGKEARTNFHVESDLMVIHKVAERFVLRLGEAVVGIWNENYDVDGIPTRNGVVAPRVERVMRRRQ